MRRVARGSVLLVGGGTTPPEVPQALIRLAGGASAPLVVLAHTQQEVASGAKRSGDFLIAQGAQQVYTPDTLDPDALAELLDQVRGVWIPGGDQNRLMQRLGHSERFLKAFRGVLERGGVVGGTSAGASLMGGLMPTGEQSPSGELRAGATGLASALGALPRCIVDQHFLKRQRLQRLLCALLEHPDYVGIGVDEQAWAIVQGETLTVQAGQVVIAQVSGGTHRHQGLLGTRGLTLQVLLPHDRVKLKR